MIGTDFPQMAEELTVMPIAVALGAGQCKAITSFRRVEGSKQRDQGRQLRQLFSGCSATNVPYGYYKIAGVAETIRFKGTCLVDQKRPVCILLSEDNSYVEPTYLRFAIEQLASWKTPIWADIKPVLDWSTADNASFLQFTGQTVSFDRQGIANLKVPSVGDFIVTIFSNGTIVGSRHIHALGTASFLVSLREGELYLREGGAAAGATPDGKR
jgi:hypothetical protein